MCKIYWAHRMIIAYEDKKLVGLKQQVSVYSSASNLMSKGFQEEDVELCTYAPGF